MFLRYVESRSASGAGDASSLVALDPVFYKSRELLDQHEQPWMAAGRQLNPTAAELSVYFDAVQSYLLSLLAELRRFQTSMWVRLASVQRLLGVADSGELEQPADVLLGQLPPPGKARPAARQQQQQQRASTVLNLGDVRTKYGSCAGEKCGGGGGKETQGGEETQGGTL